MTRASDSTIAVLVRESQTRDQGSITLIVVVFFLALLAAAGLVVDGGAKLRAAREASAVAEEAARAGAGQVDRDRAYARGGRFIVDRNAAAAAARTYLADTGNKGSVSVAGARSIRVTVTIRRPTILLSAIGIGTVHVTKTATADLLQGVETPESGDWQAAPSAERPAVFICAAAAGVKSV